MSHQLIQSTKVTENIVKPRVGYGILNSGRSRNSSSDFQRGAFPLVGGFTVPVDKYDALVPSNLGGSNQRLRLRLRLELGHGVNVAVKKTTLLKLFSGREKQLKFVKRRRLSFGGRYTKKYLRNFEKLNKTSREQVN